MPSRKWCRIDRYAKAIGATYLFVDLDFEVNITGVGTLIIKDIQRIGFAPHADLNSSRDLVEFYSNNWR